jgi:tetratricopeptide (TPR) repeat protein
MSDASQLGVPNKGSLKRTPFPSLVKKIADASVDGSLYLLSGKTKKVVFFEKGQPVFVRSNVLSECLGQILAREGLITEEQCEQTLEAIRRTGKKQGELLVEMGILSEGNLRYGLEAQLRHKLFEIFGWEEGRYQFKPGTTKQEWGMRLEAGSDGIIVSAILETHSEDRAGKMLVDESKRYAYSNGSSDIAHLGLMPGEAHFMACLDGSRTVDEVLADPESRAPTPKALLFALVQAGIVELKDDAGNARDRPPAPDEAYRNAPDGEFAPDYDPSNAVKSYEDTPLPGELPDRPDELGQEEDDEMFAAVADGNLTDMPIVEREVSEELLNAESEDMVDETFDDDDIELIADDDLEIMEDSDIEQVIEDDEEEVLADEAADDDDLGDDDDVIGDADLDDIDLDAGLDDLGDLEADEDLVMEEDGDAEGTDAGDSLMDMDELDDIDLDGGDETDGGDDAGAQSPDEDPEVVGAMRFSEGEMALQSDDFGRAVELFEAAYENGVDVAELHAMLAYARFKTADTDPEMAEHALDLLSYAAELNENLDIIHAYRGAILYATGDSDGAREAAQRALDINPYADLAMELMDRLN